jgi:hypothetical protein
MLTDKGFVFVVPFYDELEFLQSRLGGAGVDVHEDNQQNQPGENRKDDEVE